WLWARAVTAVRTAGRAGGEPAPSYHGSSGAGFYPNASVPNPPSSGSYPSTDPWTFPEYVDTSACSVPSLPCWPSPGGTPAKTAQHTAGSRPSSPPTTTGAPLAPTTTTTTTTPPTVPPPTAVPPSTPPPPTP